MAKKTRRGSRAKGGLQELGITGLSLGLFLILLPMFIKNAAVQQGLTSLRPLGLLMLVGGGLLLALALYLKQRSAQALPTENQPPSPSSPRTPRSPAQASTAAAPTSQRLEPSFEQQADSAAAPEQSRDKPARWSEGVFDLIEWRRFEAVIETLFQQAGFETKSQSHGADEGIDVWLYSRHQPGEPVSIVQCKHWHGKRIGVDKIRELRGVMAAKNIKRGQFASTAAYTPDAVEFARDNGIKLHTAASLLGLIQQRTPEQQSALLAIAFEGDYWRPTCASCGVKMVERQKRNGGAAFWGCTDYPKCKNMLPMRKVGAQAP